MLEEKSKWEPHKDATCRFQQILQLYDRLPPISLTVQVRQTRLAGHCRRSKNVAYEFTLRTFTHRQCWPNCKNLHLPALCKHWMPSKGPIKKQ